MALRDHSLDDKITNAAMDEFLDKGYMRASLRQIAAKAGVTVGAIQTRYSSKDELFTSLLTSFLEDIEAAFQAIRTDYYSGTGPNLLSSSATIQKLYYSFTAARAAVSNTPLIGWSKTRSKKASCFLIPQDIMTSMKSCWGF